MQAAFVSFASHINQGDRPRVDFDQIAKFRFDLPPLDEQRRIVANLDSLLDRSRRAREELAHVPRLVERYKQAILTKAFSGELTADWRHNNPTVTLTPESEQLDNERRTLFFATNQRQARYISPQHIPADTPFDVPDKWKWFRAEALCDFITKGTTPASSAMAAGTGEIPYIKVYNLTFNTTLDFEKDPTFISKETHNNELQ